MMINTLTGATLILRSIMMDLIDEKIEF